MNRRHVLPFAIAPIAAILLTGNPADAHSRWHSENCDGAMLAGQDYQPGYTNTATVNIDGGPAEYATTFATHFNSGSIPIPQDGQTHTVHYLITTTEPNPPATWTIDLTVVVGPCGEQQETTTTEASTTSTSTTTSTPTSLPPPTTEPANTSTTTQPNQTTTSLAPSTSSSVPPSSTTSPSTTTPPSSSVTTTPSTSPPSRPSTTQPPTSSVPPCANPNGHCRPPDTNPICTPITQPDGTNSCQTLPPTGSSTGTLALAAGCAVLFGIGLSLIRRRP